MCGLEPLALAIGPAPDPPNLVLVISISIVHRVPIVNFAGTDLPLQKS